MLLILAAVLPAFLLVLYSTFEQRREAAEYAERKALKMAQTVAEGHRTTFSSVSRMLAGLSTLAEIPDAQSAGTCSKMLANILCFSSDYANVGVALRNGDVVCSALPLTGPVNVGDRTRSFSARSRPGSFPSVIINKYCRQGIGTFSLRKKASLSVIHPAIWW